MILIWLMRDRAQLLYNNLPGQLSFTMMTDYSIEGNMFNNVMLSKARSGSLEFLEDNPCVQLHFGYFSDSRLLTDGPFLASLAAHTPTIVYSHVLACIFGVCLPSHACGRGSSVTNHAILLGRKDGVRHGFAFGVLLMQLLWSSIWLDGMGWG